MVVIMSYLVFGDFVLVFVYFVFVYLGLMFGYFGVYFVVLFDLVGVFYGQLVLEDLKKFLVFGFVGFGFVVFGMILVFIFVVGFVGFILFVVVFVVLIILFFFKGWKWLGIVGFVLFVVGIIIGVVMLFIYLFVFVQGVSEEIDWFLSFLLLIEVSVLVEIMGLDDVDQGVCLMVVEVVQGLMVIFVMIGVEGYIEVQIVCIVDMFVVFDFDNVMLCIIVESDGMFIDVDVVYGFVEVFGDIEVFVVCFVV